MASNFNQEFRVQASDKPAPSRAFDDFAKEVEQRYNDMSYVKQNRRETWDGVQRLYYPNDLNWIVSGDDFNEPIRFSTLRDVISALTDKYMENLPEAVLRPYYDEDINLIKGKRAYIEYIQRQPQYKKVRRMAIQDMFFYGIGLVRTGYSDRMKKYKDGTEREIYRDVCNIYVNPRDFFVDDAATMLHDVTGQNRGARDMIIRTMMPYSTFVKYAEKHGFSTGGVTAEPFLQALGNDWISTNGREILEKSPVRLVKMYEYERPEDDCYGIVANGHTLFEGSLKKCKGTDSFDTADYKFEPRNDSYWSQTLAEIIAPNIYTKDTIFNLELMNLKLTLQPVLAMSGDFGYNPRVHVLQPGGVWTAGSKMQGKVEDNIAPIVAGNAQTKSYEMLNYLASELTVASRTNIQSLEFAKDQTATRDMQIDQSQTAHSERISAVNEIETETVITENTLQVMEAFLTSDEAKQRKKRKIPVLNQRVRQGEDGQTVFFPKNGYEDMFHVTDEMINVPVRVEIIDKRSELAAKAEMLGRVMQFIPMITNLSQVNPEIAQRVNWMGIVEQAVDFIGLEQSKTFHDDESAYDDEYQMIKEEIILGNIVELPKDESRNESMAKLKFLLTLEKEYRSDGKEGFTKEQQRAFDHIFDQCSENIRANQLNKRYQTQNQTGISPEEQLMAEQMAAGGAPQPGLPGGQLPFQGNSAGMSAPIPTTSQALGGSQPAMKTMPQPDPSVLNPSGRELV